jgi:mannose-6-phosphate isomerase
MATSDNVLRAGLTPKHRDVDNLLASLTWTFGVTHAVAPLPTPPLSPPSTPEAKYSKVYNPPVPEFSVVEVALPQGEQEAHRAFEGPSILIVTHGTGRLTGEGGEVELKEGSVVFIGAGVGVTFATNEDVDRLVLYRAYYP